MVRTSGHQSPAGHSPRGGLLSWTWTWRSSGGSGAAEESCGAPVRDVAADAAAEDAAPADESAIAGGGALVGAFPYSPTAFGLGADGGAPYWRTGFGLA